MASKIGDSDGARRLARDLRSAADEIERAEDAFQKQLNNSTCRGFSSLARTLFDMSWLSVLTPEFRYRDLADDVARHAVWVDDTEWELTDLERRIRNWAAANPVNPDPLATAPDASLINYWPAPLSFEWRSLKARLRAHGVWF